MDHPVRQTYNTFHIDDYRYRLSMSTLVRIPLARIRSLRRCTLHKRNESEARRYRFRAGNSWHRSISATFDFMFLRLQPTSASNVAFLLALETTRVSTFWCPECLANRVSACPKDTRTRITAMRFPAWVGESSGNVSVFCFIFNLFLGHRKLILSVLGEGKWENIGFDF